MSRLTLRQFASLVSVARTGRINETAHLLGLTPPAVTLQIRQAEAEIGVALFNRTRKGLIPTEAGRTVIAAAEEIEERLRALDDELAGLIQGRKGQVRLGTVSTAKYFTPQLIAAFRATNPGIEIRLLVGNRAETIERLRHRELDLAIMGRPPRDIPLDAMVMGDHPLVFIAPPGHPLTREQAISKERMAQETFLLREPGSGTRTSLELYFAEIPDKLDTLGLEMGSNESIKQAVMAGLGIAMISAHTIAQEVRQQWLRILDVQGMPIVRQWFCITLAGRAPSAATLALRDFLTSEGVAMLPQPR
jgi:DNA-binding transcriptional LysR family regulator